MYSNSCIILKICWFPEISETVSVNLLEQYAMIGYVTKEKNCFGKQSLNTNVFYTTPDQVQYKFVPTKYMNSPQ